MSDYVITAQTVEPVSLGQAKGQCEIALDDQTRDGLVEGLIVTARQWAEALTDRVFITQTREVKLDRFPSPSYFWNEQGRAVSLEAARIELPFPPLQSVTHIKYFDGDGAEQTWSSGQYVVRGVSLLNPYVERGYITPIYGVAWPVARTQPEAVTVRFVCGYGDAAAVPQNVKQAILLRLADLYKLREPSVTGTIHKDTGADRALLGPFRTLRVA